VAQLPVGLALDLWGPRRVQTVLGLVSAAGFLICALSTGSLTLVLGRVITGLGVAAGLIAMLKVNTQWYPRDRVAGMTGLGVFVGACGGVAATVPVAWLMPLVGWRGIFGLLAALSMLVSLWIFLSVPDRGPGAPPPARRRLGAEIAEFGRIFRHRAFLVLTPSVALLSALHFTYQGLWAGPWLRDVGGLAEGPRATLLLVYALGLMVGSVLTGQAASFFQRRGASAMAVPYCAMAGMAVLQVVLAFAPPSSPILLGVVWFCFSLCGAAGPAGYTAISQNFGPDLAARVATAINVAMLAMVFVLQNAIGWILDLWPRTAEGGWDAAGYAWAFIMTLLLQLIAAAAMLGGRRV